MATTPEKRLSDFADSPRPNQSFAASLLLTLEAPGICDASFRKMLLEEKARELGFEVRVCAVGFADDRSDELSDQPTTDPKGGRS